MSRRAHGRLLRDEADARACLEAWVASGKTTREWARSQGIDGRSLHVWRLNLGRRRGQPETKPLPVEPRMVELVPRLPEVAASYLIHVGALRVEVDAGFDAEVLRRLIQVVATC